MEDDASEGVERLKGSSVAGEVEYKIEEVFVVVWTAPGGVFIDCGCIW